MQLSVFLLAQEAVPVPTSIGNDSYQIWINIFLVVATFLAVTGLPALVKYLGAKREDVAFQDGRITKGYDLAIAQMDKRIATLEAALSESRKAEMACLEAQIVLREEVKRLREESAEVAKDVRDLKS